MSGLSSGVLVQQINLYRGPASGGTPAAGARLLLFAAITALAAVIMLAAAGEFYLSRLNAERAEVSAALHAQEGQLAELKQRLAGVKVEPFLEAELARLGESKTSLITNLAAISQHQAQPSEGFSAVFGGLARNTVDGLWFSNVGLSAGGSEMLLKGKALDPALVPRLLRSLAAERAFAGRAFRKVAFERQPRESGSVVIFELRSAQTEASDDAG